VDLLESNMMLVQEVLQLTRRVLMQMFFGLWPKKKAEMPVDNLKKLAEAFDTLEDPIPHSEGPVGKMRCRRGDCACSIAR
jgi:hypothetical protein